MVNRRTVQVSEGKSSANCSVAAGEVAPLPDAGDLMAVVAHYQSPLLRYVGKMLGVANHEAEDIVQDTFVKLHRQVVGKGRKSVRNLTTWLFRTAHNQTIDVIRRRARRRRAVQAAAEPAIVVQDEAANELDALSEVLRREARQVALRELGELDDELRQVVLLKIIQGMTLRQVGEVVGVSISLVNYRLNQGLAELARRLRKAGVV